MGVIEDLIGYDTVDITVTRHTKVANAGGYNWATAVLDPQTVRLYNITTHNQREATMVEGELKEITLGILASDDADFAFGHDSYDTFTHLRRGYRVVGVRHYGDVNIDAHVQVDCVAV